MKSPLSTSAALFALAATANVEKAIFTAPPPVHSLPLPSSLSDLLPIDHLHHRPLRTNLTRVFPPEAPEPAWFLLENLTQGQRYELRVCWSALQPTDLILNIYPPTTVLETPALLTSLTQYASSRSLQPSTNHESDRTSGHVSRRSSQVATSAMLLQIHASADYFSHHPDLMTSPPPVLIDLILDPYFYNILPRSLLPTTAYLVAVTVIAAFLARYIVGNLMSIASSDERKTKQS